MMMMMSTAQHSTAQHSTAQHSTAQQHVSEVSNASTHGCCSTAAAAAVARFSVQHAPSDAEHIL
jgi:hypothetical protein